MFLHHQIICLVGIQQETSATYFREIIEEAVRYCY